MKKQIAKPSTWLLRLSSLLSGAAIVWLFRHDGGSIRTTLTVVYENVGITVIALLPLATWAVYTVSRNGRNGDVTLAYIGTTAQRVGLLGTVIGIVAATIAIGDNLRTGAATAVTSALPAVGQALVSTAVGFIIAIVCDFFRYLNNCRIDENNEVGE